jgi:hypothetical protein
MAAATAMGQVVGRMSGSSSSGFLESIIEDLRKSADNAPRESAEVLKLVIAQLEAKRRP